MRNTRPVAIAIGLFAFAACSADAPSPVTAVQATMKAVVYREYGDADVLHVEEIARPALKDHQVLVKVHAAAANPLDWHYMHGKPYLMRLDTGFRAPKDPAMGVDLAGEIVAVGKDVKKFKVGDEIFGVGAGAFAQYAKASQRRIALKPAELGYEEAAAVPVAAITALQALRDKGKLKPGQSVLINGASGGVGTFAVQLARALGAGEVAAVCSGRNAELVRSLGADRVIDYTAEDFTERAERYDVIIDNVGKRSLAEMRRALAPAGTLVIVGGGGPEDSTWGMGFIGSALERSIVDPFTPQTLTTFMAEVTTADLEYLAGLMTAGKLHAVIDRKFPLEQTPDAMRYLEAGHARGKVVVTVD